MAQVTSVLSGSRRFSVRSFDTRRDLALLVHLDVGISKKFGLPPESRSLLNEYATSRENHCRVVCDDGVLGGAAGGWSSSSSSSPTKRSGRACRPRRAGSVDSEKRCDEKTLQSDDGIGLSIYYRWNSQAELMRLKRERFGESTGTRRKVATLTREFEASEPADTKSDWMVLWFLGVADSHRRSGVGSFLMREMEQTAAREGISEIRLEVIMSNASAVKFYESCGYVDLPAKRYERRDNARVWMTTMRKRLALNVDPLGMRLSQAAYDTRPKVKSPAAPSSSRSSARRKRKLATPLEEMSPSSTKKRKLPLGRVEPAAPQQGLSSAEAAIPQTRRKERPRSSGDASSLEFHEDVHQRRRRDTIAARKSESSSPRSNLSPRGTVGRLSIHVGASNTSAESLEVKDTTGNVLTRRTVRSPIPPARNANAQRCVRKRKRDDASLSHVTSVSKRGGDVSTEPKRCRSPLMPARAVNASAGDVPARSVHNSASHAPVILKKRKLNS